MLLIGVGLLIGVIFLKALSSEIRILKSSLDATAKWANFVDKELKILQQQIQFNSSDIEVLEDANDNLPFKNRIIEILEEHLEEKGINYIVFRAEQDFNSRLR
jgi:hypothetical protein